MASSVCCCKFSSNSETPTATWTNDSRFVVSAGYDGMINWWDVQTKKKVHMIQTDDYDNHCKNIFEEFRNRNTDNYWSSEVHTLEADDQIASVAAASRKPLQDSTVNNTFASCINSDSEKMFLPKLPELG